MLAKLQLILSEIDKLQECVSRALCVVQTHTDGLDENLRGKPQADPSFNHLSDLAARFGTVAGCERALKAERCRLESLAQRARDRTASTAQRRMLVIAAHASASVRGVIAFVSALLCMRPPRAASSDSCGAHSSRELTSRIPPSKLHNLVQSICASLEDKGTEHTVALSLQFIQSRLVQAALREDDHI